MSARTRRCVAPVARFLPSMLVLLASLAAAGCRGSSSNNDAGPGGSARGVGANAGNPPTVDASLVGPEAVAERDTDRHVRGEMTFRFVPAPVLTPSPDDAGAGTRQLVPDPPVIQGLLRARADDLRACFARPPGAAAEREVRLTLHIVAGRDGAVQTAEVTNASPEPDADVRTCVLAIAREVRFPAIDSDRLDIVYPLRVLAGPE